MATVAELKAQANLLLDESFALATQAGVAREQGDIALAQQLLEQSKQKSAQAARDPTQAIQIIPRNRNEQKQNLTKS